MNQRHMCAFLYVSVDEIIRWLMYLNVRVVTIMVKMLLARALQEHSTRHDPINARYPNIGIWGPSCLSCEDLSFKRLHVYSVFEFLSSALTLLST